MEQMKVRLIVAGTRKMRHATFVREAIEQSTFLPAVILHGGADGVDTLAGRWAMLNGIPVEVYLPKWAAYGNVAGPIRNREMCKHADALLAIWDGESRGTADIIRQARDQGIFVLVRRLHRDDEGRWQWDEQQKSSKEATHA